MAQQARAQERDVFVSWLKTVNPQSSRTTAWYREIVDALESFDCFCSIDLVGLDPDMINHAQQKMGSLGKCTLLEKAVQLAVAEWKASLAAQAPPATAHSAIAALLEPTPATKPVHVNIGEELQKQTLFVFYSVPILVLHFALSVV